MVVFSLAGLLDGLPHLLRRQRHSKVAHAQRPTGASSTALTIAGGEPIVPVSPAPLTPRGLLRAGAWTVWVGFQRKADRRRAAGRSPCTSQKMSWPLSSYTGPPRNRAWPMPCVMPPCYLAFDDHGIDDIAHVINRGRSAAPQPRQSRHPPPRPLCGAPKGKVKIGWVVEAGKTPAPALAPRENCAARTRASATSPKAIDWSVPLTVQLPSANSRSSSAASSKWGGDLGPFLLDLVHALDDSCAADGQRARAIRAHAKGHGLGVAVNDIHVFDPPRPNPSATTWAKVVSWPCPCEWPAGEDGDLAGGLDTDAPRSQTGQRAHPMQPTHG